MTSAEHHMIRMLSLAAFVASAWGVRAAQGQVLQWNEAAQSNIMNRSQLVKMGEALPPWKIKQMTWPPAEELASAAVTVSEELKDACVTWLAKFMDSRQVPADIGKHLVAMRAWGLIRAESEQKRLCDVFITRFSRGSYTVHIQESPANVVITVAQESPASNTHTGHTGLLFNTAALFLKEELRPDPQSKRLYITAEAKGGIEITTATWAIESVMVEGPGDRTAYDGSKAKELGTWNVTAETDGRYIRFVIHKFIGPVRPSAYLERFAPAK